MSMYRYGRKVSKVSSVSYYDFPLLLYDEVVETGDRCCSFAWGARYIDFTFVTSLINPELLCIIVITPSKLTLLTGLFIDSIFGLPDKISVVLDFLSLFLHALL